MILEVGKKYVTKHGFIFTIISTNRKSKDGYNVVAERECVDDHGNKCSNFSMFKSDGRNKDPYWDLIKEHNPKLKVEFMIDLPIELDTYNMDEIKSLLLCELKGITPTVGAYFKNDDFKNVDIYCNYEN